MTQPEALPASSEDMKLSSREGLWDECPLAGGDANDQTLVECVSAEWLGYGSYCEGLVSVLHSTNVQWSSCFVF